VEGRPDRPGEVHLPGLREDQPAASPVSPHAKGLGRPQPAGDDPVREVRPAPSPVGADRGSDTRRDWTRTGPLSNSDFQTGKCIKNRQLTKLFTKSAQATGPENIGPERTLPGLFARVPVFSLSRITPETNGKSGRSRIGSNFPQGQVAEEVSATLFAFRQQHIDCKEIIYLTCCDLYSEMYSII